VWVISKFSQRADADSRAVFLGCQSPFPETFDPTISGDGETSRPGQRGLFDYVASWPEIAAGGVEICPHSGARRGGRPPSSHGRARRLGMHVAHGATKPSPTS